MLPIKCLIKRGFRPNGGGLVPMKPGNHLTTVDGGRKERCYILRGVLLHRKIRSERISYCSLLKKSEHFVVYLQFVKEGKL